MSSASQYFVFIVAYGLLNTVLSADPSKYVDRAAVEGLADKLSIQLHEFACEQLRTGPINTGFNCGSSGFKQLLEYLSVTSSETFTPEQFLFSQIIPQIQDVMDVVRRFLYDHLLKIPHMY